MKYANFDSYNSANMVNIGDYLMLMAIQHVYDTMGINENAVYHLSRSNISDYTGEELVLPLVGFPKRDCIKNGEIAISEKITPVFLAVVQSPVSMSFNADVFFSNSKNREYFMKHSPIGCRDEYSYNILQKYGIPSYINGCLTAIFPKREGNIKPSKVILADAPKDLLPFIPKALLDHCDITTQQYYFNEEDIADHKKIFNFVKQKYDHYKENAMMVVTSRLHAALPCIAYGIPVILARDYIDYRFSFIEKYIPIYSREQYGNINWSPQAPDISDTKERLIELASSRIRGAVDSLGNGRYLTEWFLSREKHSAYTEPHKTMHKNEDRLIKFVKEFPCEAGIGFNYALWGVSESSAEFWAKTIGKYFPNAELMAVIDTFKSGQCNGVTIYHPDDIQNMPEMLIFVCGVGAVSSAYELFEKCNIPEGRYCILVDSFISEKHIDAERDDI
jgi:hypothetical protein